MLQDIRISVILINFKYRAQFRLQQDAVLNIATLFLDTYGQENDQFSTVLKSPRHRAMAFLQATVRKTWHWDE